MRDRFDEVKSREIEVLGISFDTVEENRHFAEKFDFPFKLLCDTERKVGLAYGTARTTDEGYAKRSSFLIDESGKVQLVYPNVNPAEHLDRVLEDLAG